MTEKEKIDDYLSGFKPIDKEKYLEKELERIKPKQISAYYKKKFEAKEFKCFYCDIDIRIIQELIYKRIIDPRKRGKKGYSGMHFEIEHKDSDNKNNNECNIEFCCYYCNNDKSNTISAKTFKEYFGKKRGEAFKELYKTVKLGNISNLKYYHNK
jgi:hypothetical protein